MSIAALSDEMRELWSAEKDFRGSLVSGDLASELKALEKIIVLSIRTQHPWIRKRGVSALGGVAASTAAPAKVKSLASAAVFALEGLAGPHWTD